MRILLILMLFVCITIPQYVFAETGDLPMLFYGEASWYGVPYHGRQTASGEVFDMNKLSAAHPTLPFGTLLKVTNLENDKSVTVRVNDRGPFVRDRVLDLSMAAASLLDFQDKGTAKVEARVVQLGDGKAQAGNAGAGTASALAPAGGAGTVPSTASGVSAADRAPENAGADRGYAESLNIVPRGPSANSENISREPSANSGAAPREMNANSESVSREPSGAGTVRIIRPEDVRQTGGQEARQTGSTVSPSPDGRFVIQAGAFLSLANAEGLLRRYQDMGLPVYLRQLPGDRLQRVWVGPFANRAEADAQLRLARSVSEQAFICDRE